MWKLDSKEGWALKNWCFQTVMLKTLKSPLDSKEIKPVSPKGYQHWIFIGRTDVEAETLILWPPDMKNWLIGKDPDAGKDWGQWEKRVTENEMVGWHHWLNGHELQTLGDGIGQGSLACCSPWGRKESDTIEQLNNNNMDVEKTKNIARIWSSNPAPGHIFGENHNSKQYMHPNVHCGIFYISWDRDTT